MKNEQLFNIADKVINKVFTYLESKEENVIKFVDKPENREYLLKVIEAVAAGFGRGIGQGLAEELKNNG